MSLDLGEIQGSLFFLHWFAKVPQLDAKCRGVESNYFLRNLVI